MSRGILADTSSLQELKEVFCRYNLHCVLLGLSLDQLLINSSVEEIIETYIKLHQSKHEFCEYLNRLLVKLRQIECL